MHLPAGCGAPLYGTYFGPAAGPHRLAGRGDAGGYRGDFAGAAFGAERRDPRAGDSGAGGAGGAFSWGAGRAYERHDECQNAARVLPAGSGGAGILAWFGRSLFQVAVLSCVVVFVLELFM